MLCGAFLRAQVLNMGLLKLLIITLTFSKLIVDLDAHVCPKGQRVVEDDSGFGCKPCLDGYYQPVENDSKYCRGCTKCTEKKGSYVLEKCTIFTNTKCHCREGFVPSEKDPSSTCRCNIGFGIILGENGAPLKCSECPTGYFNKHINSHCRKWKQCTAGVNKTGTTTSDVTCNEPSRSSHPITTPSTSVKVVSLLAHLTSVRPHEGAQTQTTQTTTTTAARARTAPPKDTGHPPSDTGTYIGTAMTLFGIVGLLVLTAVTCKLHIRPTTQSALPENDSLCRSPVEESGNGSVSSSKPNSGED